MFALPIMMTPDCVGALDLFRKAPGPLGTAALGAAKVVAELAAIPLLDLVHITRKGGGGGPGTGWDSSQDLDRIEVDPATGMLISQRDVDAGEALVRLRAHAIATGQTASDVAWAILDRKLVLDRDDGGGERRGDS